MAKKTKSGNARPGLIHAARLRKLIFREHMPPNCKLVLLALAEFADYETGENARPAQATLARMTRLSERTVRGVLREIEDNTDLLSVQRRPGRTTIYSIAVDTPAAGGTWEDDDTPDADYQSTPANADSYPGRASRRPEEFPDHSPE